MLLSDFFHFFVNSLFFFFLSLLQDLVNLLKPFLNATELLSGSKYTTLSFLYPTMYLLMDTFSMNNKSDDELFDLIYEPLGNFFLIFSFY